ncbi:MAG: HD domain-containing phosphohydrolase [Candidatus Zhuqueibacterota bacterium]
MQHEQTPIFYLSEKVDSVIENVIGSVGPTFKHERPESAEDIVGFFHNQQSHFILILDSAFFLKIAADATYLAGIDSDRFSIIHYNAAGQDPFDTLASSSTLPVFTSLSVPLNKSQLALALINSRKLLLSRLETKRLQSRLELQNQELRQLNDIGIALSAERDPDALLEMILRKSREITLADAGSLYLVEHKNGTPEDANNYFANKQLRFKLAHCDSITIPFKEAVMPIQKKSIAGYVALSGQVVNIPDVYHLPADSEFGHNRSFDESVGYRTKSMLVIPMKNHKDEIIGVLQLINKKKNWHSRLSTPEAIAEAIVDFDEKCVDLANSLASQAAVSIENNRLYEEIKKLFEGFIKASVHAIEQRDPTTSGHSERVAILTTELARKVDQVDVGRFKYVKFSRDQIQQINYASLLHDFGKIGVREDVLVKAKKLFPHELDALKSRFKIIKQATELDFSKEKITALLEKEREKAIRQFRLLDEDAQKRIVELDRFLEFICEVNEPTVLKETGFEMLEHIAELIFRTNGDSTKLLTPREVEALSIPKGSLSNRERVEIESHVTHTFNFLSRIPWTTELRQVPEIAYAHHEKLDGSGYPRGLDRKDIPIQSQMMTIADIYDALTAWDRPYKRAVPVEKALQILQWEVNDGKVDADLFKLFVEAKVFDMVRKPDNA